MRKPNPVRGRCGCGHGVDFGSLRDESGRVVCFACYETLLAAKNDLVRENNELRVEIARLRRLNEGLITRAAAQSDLLTQKAMRGESREDD